MHGFDEFVNLDRFPVLWRVRADLLKPKRIVRHCNALHGFRVGPMQDPISHPPQQSAAHVANARAWDAYARNQQRFA